MNFDEDYVIALQLQEQFDKENLPTKPSCLDIPGTTPLRDKKISWNVGNKENISKKSSSLVDPSWEYVDPTPDIHALFMQFNKRFFWQELDSVEVRWSPRMTKCAGICCYQGRRGLCSIRLSLPLLKLRPRKDLVETLLHEMIHAYLFITNNNRDRNGHGPEFHKHMYRINREAGTNITVFHSFHAEVKLYQQHWWRCDGSCQKLPPFFGMVKRSMNRAPGPADFWWAQHQATCGGRFIKVREPEGYSKKPANAKKSQTGSPAKDIRTFFSRKGNVLKPPHNGFEKPGEFKKKPMPKMIVPFPKDLDQKSSFLGKGRGGLGGGMLANKGGGTVVITTKGKTNDDGKMETEMKGTVINSPSSTSSSLLPSGFVPFSGKGYTLGAPTTNALDKPWLSRLDKLESVVSNRNKPDHFRSRAPPSPGKRKCIHDKKDESCKRVKSGNDSVLDRGNASCTQPEESRVTCPVCDLLVVEKLLNDHLDSCLQGAFSSDDVADDDGRNGKCVLCNRNIDKVILNSSLCCECLHAANVESAESNSNSIINCPMCDKQVPSDDLDRHLETCLAGVLNDDVVVISDKDSDEEPVDDGEPVFPCPCCGSIVQQNFMNTHLDECLSLKFLENNKD